MTKRLQFARFQQAVSKHNTWSATPDIGTTFEDVLQPDYWAHIATRFRPTDLIEVHPEDGSYFAVLYVRQSDRLWAKVAVVQHVQFEQPAEAREDNEFTVKHNGRFHKWIVLRNSDREILAKELETRADAERWIDDYRRKVAA
jgi:hypothetical protein